MTLRLPAPTVVPPQQASVAPFASVGVSGERALRQVLDAVPTPAYTTDAQGLLTSFNPACVEFAGRTPQLGQDRWSIAWKLFHPDGRPMPHEESPMAIALRERREVLGAEA